MEEFTNYAVSHHAMLRYAERIMHNDGSDANRYVASNETKIKADVNKLIQYGNLIFTGRQVSKDGKGSFIDVFIKDTWAVLADSKNKNVITLYKIDLGLGDEFNLTYIAKMLEKLNASKQELDTAQAQIDEEYNTYIELIAQAESQIKEYRTMIKHLEELCVGYKTIIENNHIKKAKAIRDVAEIVNSLISKKEF